LWERDASDLEVIWVSDEAKYFRKRGWTEVSQNSPTGKSAGVMDWSVNDQAGPARLAGAISCAETRFAQHGVDGRDDRNARRA
jgi:hypothetical protein